MYLEIKDMVHVLCIHILEINAAFVADILASTIQCEKKTTTRSKRKTEDTKAPIIFYRIILNLLKKTVITNPSTISNVSITFTHHVFILF